MFDEGVQHQIEDGHLHWDVVLKTERHLHQRSHHAICIYDWMEHLDTYSLCGNHYIPRTHIVFIGIEVYGYYKDEDGANKHNQNFKEQSNLVFH
jgi:hypothetical protein